MTEKLKPLVRKIFDEAYNKGNLSVLDALIAPVYLRHQSPMKNVKGLDAYKKFVGDVRQAYSQLEIKVEDILEEGDTTVARILLTGKHTGKAPTLMAPPTGRHIAMPACVVSIWKDGKIVEEWAYNDYLGQTLQLGIMPLPVGGFE